MRRWVVIAALLAGDPGLCRAESLFDSILLAYQTNPTLRSQRAQLRAIDEGYVQARSGYGPQVALTGQGSYQGARVQQAGSLFSGPTDTTYRARTASADLSIVQPLYTAGATRAEVKGAAADILAGRESLREAESKLIETVITAYMDVRRDRETVKILKDEIVNLTAEFEETKAKGEGGQLTKTDVAESTSRLLSAQAQLNLALGRLNASNAEYLAVVGQSPGELDPEPDLAGVPGTVDEAFDAAQHNNPRLLGAIDTERAAREKVNQAKAAFGPTVSLKIDAAAAPYLPYLEKQYDRSLTGALTFSQPLFTSGLANSRVREAADRESAALLDIEAARRGVVQLVGQAWSQLVFTRDALTIEQRQVEAERISVEGNQVEERAGLRTTIELLNAELELADSRVSLVQSRHDEYIARADLLSGMGLLEARFLVPSAEIYDPNTSFAREKTVDSPPWESAVGALDRLGAPDASEPRPSAPGAGADHPVDLPPLPSPQP